MNKKICKRVGLTILIVIVVIACVTVIVDVIKVPPILDKENTDAADKFAAVDKDDHMAFDQIVQSDVRTHVVNDDHSPIPVDEGKLIEIKDTLGLRIYQPVYSTVELCCGTMPREDESDVIFVAEAAFTFQLKNTFSHSNIVGSHTSEGTFYEQGVGGRVNGTFAYFDNKPHFQVDGDQNALLMEAARKGGMGFLQEPMIHMGQEVPHTREAGDVNKFRALCLIGGRLSVADSKGAIKFGDFIDKLLKAGAIEALYLDMGSGWNHSWYRDNQGKVIEIYPVAANSKYCTNWITFQR